MVETRPGNYRYPTEKYKKCRIPYRVDNLKLFRWPFRWLLFGKSLISCRQLFAKQVWFGKQLNIRLGTPPASVIIGLVERGRRKVPVRSCIRKIRQL